MEPQLCRKNGDPRQRRRRAGVPIPPGYPQRVLERVVPWGGTSLEEARRGGIPEGDEKAASPKGEQSR